MALPNISITDIPDIPAIQPFKVVATIGSQEPTAVDGGLKFGDVSEKGYVAFQFPLGYVHPATGVPDLFFGSIVLRPDWYGTPGYQPNADELSMYQRNYQGKFKKMLKLTKSNNLEDLIGKQIGVAFKQHYQREGEMEISYFFDPVTGK